MRSIVIAVLVAVASAQAPAGAPLYIRANQLGYLPGEIKSAVVFSTADLEGKRFEVVDLNSSAAVFSASLGRNTGSYGGYDHYYPIDFSAVKAPGRYVIRLEGERSYEFLVGEQVYNRLVDSLLLFFRVQRCGNTDPLLHKPCHLHDVTSLRSSAGTRQAPKDLTGGWHDAGDYVKFLNTTAYAAYTLIFTYEFILSTSPGGGAEPGMLAQQTSGTTGASDGAVVTSVHPLLQEARIGLEWLLKLPVGRREIITQVQDLRDHDEGWRMPEDDLLGRDRPGFVGMGKNLVGIYVATMALASRIWRETLHDDAFADRCLTAAEHMYAIRNEVPDVDSSGTGTYRDTHYAGKLALGAAELYLTTQRGEFLKQATTLATKAGADHWWSWGDVNSYAHYRLAAFDKRFLRFLKENLVSARSIARTHMFSEAAEGRWGSNNSILGVALQAILWKRLTGETTFDTLATLQRDFMLGRNQWGISFVSNIGTNFSRHFHSQIAHLNGGYLPGAFAAGPITAAILRQFTLPLDGPDKYKDFQAESATYHDDRMDWVTNEPTITGGATALFVMAYYARK